MRMGISNVHNVKKHQSINEQVVSTAFGEPYANKTLLTLESRTWDESLTLIFE